MYLPSLKARQVELSTLSERAFRMTISIPSPIARCAATDLILYILNSTGDPDELTEECVSILQVSLLRLQPGISQKELEKNCLKFRVVLAGLFARARNKKHPKRKGGYLQPTCVPAV